MLISLPQATSVSDGSGIWLLDICYTCYFLIPLSTKYSEKNIRNRKCLQTCRKLCCTHQISVAQPAAQIPTRQGPSHCRVPTSSHHHLAFLLLEWPRKIKADHFAYWGPLMNSYCREWMSFSMTLSPLHLYLQKAQSKGQHLASDMGPRTYNCFPMYTWEFPYPSKAHSLGTPFFLPADSSHQSPRKCPHPHGCHFLLSPHGDLLLSPLKALARREIGDLTRGFSLYCTLKQVHMPASKADWIWESEFKDMNIKLSCSTH